MSKQYSALVLRDKPLSYWKLDETSGTSAADLGSASLTGTYTTSPTLGKATAVPSDGGRSVQFGSSSYVLIPSTSALDNASGFTVEAMAMLHSVANGGVFDKPVGTTTNTGYSLFFDASGTPALVFRTKPSSSGYVDLTYAMSNFAVDRWYHVVATWDGTTKRIYVDGTQVASVAWSGPLATGAGTPAIGRLIDLSTYSIAGKLDEVAVYAGALSASVIAEHAAAVQSPAGGIYSSTPENLLRSGTVAVADYNNSLPVGLYDGVRAAGAYNNVSGTRDTIVNLGRAYFVDHINFLLYYGDTRTYTNVGLYGSLDGTNWTTLRAPANYQPSVNDIAGLDISVRRPCQYLKFHGEGSPFNSNDWIEFEIWTGLSPMTLGGGYG